MQNVYTSLMVGVENADIAAGETVPLPSLLGPYSPSSALTPSPNP